MFDLFTDPGVEKADKYSNATALRFRKPLPCGYNLHKPPGLPQTRAKHAHTVNNYLNSAE